MTGVRQVAVIADEAGQRLDRWFKRRYPAISHGQLQKLLRTGQVRVDGGRVKADTRLEEGATVRVPPLADTPAIGKSKPRRVDADDARALQESVLFKDDWMIALNKPPGLAVQGGSKTAKHLDGMLDALRFGAAERPRLVHRLDKDTSGVLLLARTRKAATALSRAFQGRETEKTYWALVKGVPRPREGEITSRMQKDGGAREKMRSDDAGQKAITDYVTIDQAARKAAWLALRPVTGRTHQLRVHCAELGTPIVGDGKYGGSAAFIDGISGKLHLHARGLVAPHPHRGVISVTAPLPQHMARTWGFFEFDPDFADDVFEDV